MQPANRLAPSPCWRPRSGRWTGSEDDAVQEPGASAAGVTPPGVRHLVRLFHCRLSLARRSRNQRWRALLRQRRTTLGGDSLPSRSLVRRLEHRPPENRRKHERSEPILAYGELPAIGEACHRQRMCWSRKPCSNPQYCGVVNRKKIGEGLVSHVNCERGSQYQPRIAKQRRDIGGFRSWHGVFGWRFCPRQR